MKWTNKAGPYNPKPKLLITGAAGLVGRWLSQRLRHDYQLILVDRQPQTTLHDAKLIALDLAISSEQLAILLQEVPFVIHLAANPQPSASWTEVLHDNVQASLNVFDAAHTAGCQRVIFASSLHAVAGYWSTTQPSPRLLTGLEVPPYCDGIESIWPLTPYGYSKVWAERVAEHFSQISRLSILCLRLGYVLPRYARQIHPSEPYLKYVLTLPDCEQLFRCALNAPLTLKFGCYSGISNNQPSLWPIQHTRTQLNYHPIDDAFLLAKRNYPVRLRRFVGHWLRRSGLR